MFPNRGSVLVASMLVLALCLLGVLGAVSVADTGNETVDHEHPDEAEDEGDDGAISRWLSDELDERLGSSSVHLSEGQHEDAREVLGDEYDELLERYAEVDDGEDDEWRSEEEFREARENQRNLTDEVEAYDRTYEAYQQAVDEGDDDRARDLARDLDELAASIEERSDRADAAYERAEEETGRDTTTERESIEDVRTEIERQHSEVREREFVETDLDIAGEPTEISFSQPMTLSGTVSTADGDPVANEPISLEIAGQRVSTTTTATGSFSVSYRPTVLPLNATTLDVEYVPERGSPYVGSNASVPVAVEQTDSTTDVTEHTESAAFGDDLVVNGTVNPDDGGADAVPMVLVIDGEVYDRVETTENGTFSLNTTLPADVPAEGADVRVRTDLDDRALSNSEADVPISIEETPSEIDVRVEPTGEDGAIVAGELRTAVGEPLENQTIEIDVEGDRTEVQTTEEGTFDGSITLPDQPTATVTVSYANPGSNIEDTETSVTIDLGDDGASAALDGLLGAYGVPVSGDVLLLAALVSIVGVVLLVGIGRRVWFRRSGGEEGSVGTLTGSVEGTSNTRAIRALLLVARERARAGETDRAIEFAYAAARLALGRGPSDAMTHWEFYETCLSDGLSAEELDRLESLTTRYEAAAYAPYTMPDDAATESIGDAERFAE